VASAYSADSRSYGGSRDRALSRHDELGVIPGSAPYGDGDDYAPARGWDSPSPEAAAPSFEAPSFSDPAFDAPAFGDPYGSRTGGWPGSDHAHPSGPLEPLPALSGSAEPAASWYSAPTPAAGAQGVSEPSYQAWDHAPEPLTGSDYGQLPRYGTGHDPGFTAPGYDDDRTGYSEASHGYDGATGYGDTGYGQSAHGWKDADHQLPDYRSSDSGYSRGSAGYEQPGYDRDDAGYQLPGYGSGDSGYQLPDHGAGSAGYDPSGHDPGDSGYFDQGPGYGHHPGYDGGRR
jgi:hypothetical protein